MYFKRENNIKHPRIKIIAITNFICWCLDFVLIVNLIISIFYLNDLLLKYFKISEIVILCLTFTISILGIIIRILIARSDDKKQELLNDEEIELLRKEILIKYPRFYS